MSEVFKQQAVLLVEDEASSRMLVGRMLQRLGFGHVLFAEDGQQAITFLNNSPITAVVTDFRMPGIHGLQLLKAIRTGKTKAMRNLPCGLLTGHAERHLVNLAIVLDADTFLAKPVSSDTLAKHLGRIFQYRFEPLDVEAYERIDVDNAAPHLAMDLPVVREKVAEEEEEPVQAESPPPPQSAPEAPPAAKAPPPKTAPEKREKKAAKPSATAAKPALDFGKEDTAHYSRKSKKVAIADVPENAIIARNVMGSGGTLLLAAGTRFRKRYAKRLEDLHKLEGNIDHLWVVEE